MELSVRTRHILESPVLSTLLTLAAPNLAEVVARITFNTVDAVFVSWTGPDGLAAVAVVFPILLIVHSCTAAGFGFGVSSAISRALGAGNPEGAARLAGTAVILAILGAIFTTTVMLIAGPMLYAFLGVSGNALHLATTYSLVLFGGIIFVWLMNILANISRGSGIMTVAAFGVFFGEIAHVSLSPILILGWGPIPSLGVVGAAIGVLTAYALGAILIRLYFLFGHPVVRIQLQHLRIRLAASHAILRIGGPAVVSVLIFFSISLLTTGLIGRLGNAAIAGYGMAMRLEILQYPLTATLGSAVITMMATAAGAGNRHRAGKIALMGCSIAAAIGMIFSMIALVFGNDWMALLTDDREIRSIGALYLLCQAPVFPVFAAGMVAVFGCYGIGAARAPLLINGLRLTVAAIAGWLAVQLWGTALPVFLAVALAGLTYGIVMLLTLYHQFTRTA